MEIFSNEVAYTLQYVTFPLEVVGLTLALIEIRFTQYARRIENLISRSYEFYRRRHLAAETRELTGAQKIQNFFYFMTNLRIRIALARLIYISGFTIAGMMFAAILVFLTPLGDFVFSVLLTYTPEMVVPIVQLLAAMTLLIMLAVLLYYSWSALSRFASSFVEGRVIGTLGIVIAGFGVLGEAYQFTAQLVV